jgi:hypothetical protein
VVVNNKVNFELVIWEKELTLVRVRVGFRLGPGWGQKVGQVGDESTRYMHTGH